MRDLDSTVKTAMNGARGGGGVTWFALPLATRISMDNWR